jgi:hypothetical protein
LTACLRRHGAVLLEVGGREFHCLAVGDRRSADVLDQAMKLVAPREQGLGFALLAEPDHCVNAAASEAASIGFS